MFSCKLEDEEKTVNMSVLPLCKPDLHLHVEGANYINVIWKQLAIS